MNVNAGTTVVTNRISETESQTNSLQALSKVCCSPRT